MILVDLGFRILEFLWDCGLGNVDEGFEVRLGSYEAWGQQR